MMAPKVIRVSKHGFRLLLGDEELLLPFVDFALFKGVTTEQLCDVEWPSPDHLYWPLLDVDLSVESIRHPGRFPLVSKAVPDANAERKPSTQLVSPDWHRERRGTNGLTRPERP